MIYETVFAHMQGTSVQRPIVANIIALLNDRLATVGRPPMEFSSPWLYMEGWQTFTDVTTNGSSVQCSRAVPVHQTNATEGRNPVRLLGRICCRNVVLNSFRTSPGWDASVGQIARAPGL